MIRKIAVPRTVVDAERLKLVVIPEVRKRRLPQEDEDVVEIVRFPHRGLDPALGGLSAFDLLIDKRQVSVLGSPPHKDKI